MKRGTTCKRMFAARSAAANFFKVCTFRLQNKAFFQGFKLSDLPNRPVKYLKNSKIIRTDFVVVPRRPPSFRRFCENVH